MAISVLTARLFMLSSQSLSHGVLRFMSLWPWEFLSTLQGHSFFLVTIASPPDWQGEGMMYIDLGGLLQGLFLFGLCFLPIYVVMVLICCRPVKKPPYVLSPMERREHERFDAWLRSHGGV